MGVRFGFLRILVILPSPPIALHCHSHAPKWLPQPEKASGAENTRWPRLHRLHNHRKGKRHRPLESAFIIHAAIVPEGALSRQRLRL